MNLHTTLPVNNPRGFAKGILLEKEGIKRVQLPQSMIKMLPVDSSTDNRAIIAFKKLIAPTYENILFQRYLDPEEETADSFKTKSHAKLSNMYQRILIGYGIPKTICDNYVKRSQNIDRRKHVHLLGVADPTACIPYGQVFIPGCE